MKSECKHLPRWVTSLVVRLQCGSSCMSSTISRRWQAVPGLCSAVINYSTYYKRHAGFTHVRTHMHTDLSHLCRTNVGHRVMDAVSDWP